MKPTAWPEVDRLYHAALERPAAERQSFLEAACGADADLRAEVLSLLACEGEAEQLLEQPALAAVTERLAVAPGSRLGPYEVTGVIGVGGMGEVYRALDPRLGRDVAIKVLPEHVAHDAVALARLEREARAVAALSHPHIATLYDVGEQEGTRYLVMEAVEGETLAARLRREPLTEKEALRVGAEIAAALGAAHARGIVHRDVKPGNVMLTRSGAKLLDFGLARLPRRPGAPGGDSTDGLGEGLVAGTLPYVAPERLEGHDADGRADVWALGCVLFEMLAGRRAFEADCRASLIAAIGKDETPSLESSRPGTSPALDRLVRLCLTKDPAERWQSAQDLALQLREMAEGEPPREPSRRRAPRVVVVAAATALLALLAGVAADRLWLRLAGARPRPVVRSQLVLPPDAALTPAVYAGVRLAPSRTEIAIDPGGTLLAWSGSPDGSPEGASLHTCSLASGVVRRIAGTEGASQPLFSPDGRWIAFLSGGRLRKVPAEGGLVVDLADTAADGRVVMGGSWGPDGRIFLGSHLSGLSWVPSEGGPLRGVSTVDSTQETGHRLPFVLPGGRALLFTTRPHPWGVRARVEALDLATGRRQALVEDCADARYLPSGHLVCLRRGVLMAAPFDAGRLELEGPVVPVLESVLQALNLGAANIDSGAGQLAVSATGLLVYASGGIVEAPPAELVLVDEAGRAAPLPGFDQPMVGIQNRFSPDGRQLASTERAPYGRLWLFDVERGTHVALSHDGLAGSPVWSPDGRQIAVGWSRAGMPGLWLVPTEGGGGWTSLGVPGTPSSWSPDGRVLAFLRGGDVLLYRFEDRQVVPFLSGPFPETGARFSPDGRWVAYVSSETGRAEVYVASYPDHGDVHAVSRDGGLAPVWSRDGRRILFRSLDHRSLVEVPLRSGPQLELGQPRLLLAEIERATGPVSVGAFDLHPDGRRFLFTRFAPPASPLPVARLDLVDGWFAELRRLAPTGR